ncbi:oligopeptide ABC transporter, ATP-binding subunit [Fructilactobacillus fructivorans]|nr:oligopeptide ABC transporter, ATP-binding subunit [Fructilactobacillus fructivorans]
MQDIQEKEGLTYLFIAHDLSMVKYISDRIAVMYNGKIVEMADTDELYNHPLHKYTQSLLSAVPVPDPHSEKQHKIIKFDHSKPFKDDQYLQEVTPGHWLYCSDEEAKQYK